MCQKVQCVAIKTPRFESILIMFSKFKENAMK